MSEPINIPGRRQSQSYRNSGSIISPNQTQDFNIYKIIKKYKDDNEDNIYNMSNFFQQLSTDNYTLTVNKDKFHALKQFITIGDREYNYNINFNINRNWLSLYTDFILINAETVDRVAIICNNQIIYQKDFDYTNETKGFFLSRPNVLPLLTMPLLNFKMSIFIYSQSAKTRLLYSEIKIKPEKHELQSIICLLNKWYIVIDGKKIFFYPEHTNCICIDNVWEILNNIPEVKLLNYSCSI